MTILLYDYIELEDRASKNLRVWKVLHTTLYVCAAVFGALNFTFLFETEYLVESHCVLYPRKLAFHWVELPNATDVNDKDILLNNDTKDFDAHNDLNNTSEPPISKDIVVAGTENVTNAQITAVPEEEKAKIDKRDVNEFKTIFNETIIEDDNVTIITGNKTHRLVLQPSRTLFPKETDTRCQFSEYMPLLSATFAIVWATLFIMCPGGGRTRTGLQQPYGILTPALVFALVMVILTGYSFTATNGGLQAFCAGFYNYTNTTACSAVNPFIERSWNTSWDLGSRVSATRATSAGVWATWSCVAALLLARCLAAPDFVVKRTAVHLIKDPQQKVTPYLQKQKSQKSPSNSKNSRQCSPSKRDTASIVSQPTNVTELVTASVEHEDDSQPTSLATTPIKMEKLGESLEMIQIP